ncbi:hypothetical protein AVEN_218525-1 [Araneus ventricosus]|uniref:Uncharacterized protein n=1 Tax=Araneus ventricosus TaxID=182803 RepID=A0A4Y2RZM2_ARAVE|nr:hypothetical protein AVEN_218525-1 [Araneus ventricosus]
MYLISYKYSKHNGITLVMDRHPGTLNDNRHDSSRNSSWSPNSHHGPQPNPSRRTYGNTSSTPPKGGFTSWMGGTGKTPPIIGMAVTQPHTITTPQR